MEMIDDHDEKDQLELGDEGEVPAEASFYDEAFLEYLHSFGDAVKNKIEDLQEVNDKKRENYYRGVYFALRAISRVYQAIATGDFV